MMFRSRWTRSSAWLACVGVASLGVTMAAAVQPENLIARAIGGVGRTCPDATILVSILTDNYGGETSWEVTENPGGTVEASGGPLSSSTLYSIEVCVDPAGCYDFTIYDSFGDGICCGWGEGWYEVYYDGNLVDGGGEFDSSDTVSDIGGGCADRIAGGADPEHLVRESFAFLLKREPKESILASFDLTVIARYFPEYERAMAERFGS